MKGKEGRRGGLPYLNLFIFGSFKDTMPTLIASLSTGKGTWTEVSRIMQTQPWMKVFLITNQFGVENFTSKPATAEFVVIDPNQEVSVITERIIGQLRGKIDDFEIALNMVSGSGKEHMAIVEAVLELGLNFRLITVVNGQVETLGIKR